MSTPQLEDGYTKIANEILEVISKAKFNGTQFKIVMAIWRYTYGFNKKEGSFSINFLSEATATNRDQIKRELSNLINKKVILEVKKADFNSARILSFNKNFSEWVGVLDSLEGANLPTDGEKGHPQGANSPTGEGANPPSPQGANSPPKKEIYKKNIKEIYKKNNSGIPYQEIFDLYVQQEIIKHKSITEKMKKAIKKAATQYSIDEIKLAIMRYGQMYRDKENEYAKSYCKYQWTLEELMTRDKGISEFLDEGGKWIRYLRSSNSKEQDSSGFDTSGKERIS